MKSKAFAKSTNNIVASRFFARTPSRIQQIVKICDVVDLFLRKPFWFLPVSWYLISLLWMYLCSCMRVMSMLWSITNEVSSGSCPILFKVLTLNVTICIVRLHFSKYCFSLSSVADFSNTEARAPNLSIAVYILIDRSQPYRWAAVVPRSNYWSWPLNRWIHTPSTWLGIVFNRQRVYPLAFTSTILLPMTFIKIFFSFSLSFFLLRSI